MEVLLTMAAQRYGVRPSTYMRTRTYMEFWLDVRAMTQTWAWPLTVLTKAFGRKSEGEGSGGSGMREAPLQTTSGRPIERLPPWYRTARGRRYKLHDLGPIKGEEDLPLGRKRTMAKADMDAASRSLIKSFGVTKPGA